MDSPDLIEVPPDQPVNTRSGVLTQRDAIDFLGEKWPKDVSQILLAKHLLSRLAIFPEKDVPTDAVEDYELAIDHVRRALQRY